MQIGTRPLDVVYAELIKPIRNKMRSYAYVPLLDALLTYLNVQVADSKNDDRQRLPWVAERLIIWLFAERPQDYGVKVANAKDIKALVFMAWNAADGLYRDRRTIKDIGLFVRQAMLPQIPYQQSLDTHAFGLQLQLIRKLPSNCNLRSFLDEKAKMPIENYFQLAVVYWAHSISASPWFNKAFVDDLVPLFSADQQSKFIDSMTRNLSDFQQLCRTRTIEIDEWFQPTYFYKSPCLYHSGAVVSFGAPTLRRFFEGLVLDWIAGSDDNSLRRDFDKLIEAYVQDALVRAQLTFLTEKQIQLLKPAGKTVDFLADESDGVVLIEVKNKGLSRSIPATREPLKLASSLKATIVKARDQISQTAQELQHLPQYKNKKFYGLIVTNNDLWLTSTDWLRTAKEEDFSMVPTCTISLRELDLLVEFVRIRPCSIVGILEKFFENQRNSLSATYSLESFLDRDSEQPKKIATHLVQEIESVLSMMNNKLA